jgi:hypothetical protein
MEEDHSGIFSHATSKISEEIDPESDGLHDDEGLLWLAEWAIGGFIGLCVVGLFLALMSPKKSNRHHSETAGLDNLRSISLAMMNYQSANMHFPPAYIADEDGKPMHSWRVLLLPFLEQENLYERYSFDEPWDGPNNSKLHDEIVELYQCPTGDARGSGVNGSHYMVVVGQGTGFEADHETTMAEVRDGTTNTLLLVEVRSPTTHWMEPVDLTLAEALMRFSDAPTAEASVDQVSEITVSLMDASTHTIDCPISAENLKALATIDGGELVDINDL